MGVRDITDQCTFSPAPGTSLTANQNLVVTYGSYTVEQPLYVYTPQEFNSSVKISNIITDCNNMFNGCTALDQPITIGENVTICDSMFSYCQSFNQPLTIPTNVTNAVRMFDHCHNFDQPIVIDNITNCQFMFKNCHSFNQAITTPANAIYCTGMFQDCYNLQKPITVSYNCQSYAGIFQNCFNLQEVNINCASVTDAFNVNSAFENCNSLTTINFLQDGPYECKYLINSRSNDVQLNIFVDNKESLLNIDYMMGDTPITWSEGSGYIYNSEYNINIYSKTLLSISITQMPQQYYPADSYLDLGLIKVNAIYE